MVVYLGIAFFFLTFYIISEVKGIKIDDRTYFIICFFASLFLVLFAGTRYEIGLDYQGYKNIYELTHIYKNRGYGLSQNIFMTLKSYDADPFYIFLNILVPSYNMMLFLMAMIGVGIKCYCITVYTENKFLYFFMYFCEIYLSYDMGVMRQGTAMSFMLLALISVEKNHKIGFFLCVLLGSLFQVIAILIIPMYWLGKIKISYKGMMIFTALVSPFALCNVGKILLAISRFMRFSRIEEKLSYYITNEASYTYSTLAKTLLIFLLLLYGYYKNGIEKEDTLYLKSYWYGLMLMEIFFSFPILATRGTKFFYFSQLFAVDRLQRKSKNSVITYVLILLLCSIYFMNLCKILPGSESNAYQGYLPYNSYLMN